MSNTAVELLEKLIAFKSITPKGKDAIDYLVLLLSDYGFTCDIKAFGEGKEETTNLYAFLGNSKPNVCFAGHIDVVPPGDLNLWHSDPFTAVIRENKIFGRGAVDMKGALAASLASTFSLLDMHKQPNGTISFLLTTDEEGSGKHGTKKMLEYIKDKYAPIDLCILGEPTCEHKIGDIVKIGRRGSINFQLKINGKQGHVAYPNLAQNPLPLMLNVLNELANTSLDNGSKYFDRSNLEITSIDTDNHVTNVIPGTTSAAFNIRFNDHHNDKSLENLVHSIIRKHCNDYDLKYSCSSNSFIQEYTENMKKFVTVIEKVTGLTTSISTKGGTSDARFIHQYCEVIEFGLKSDEAHKIDENCKISDLQTLCKVYYAYLVESLFSIK